MREGRAGEQTTAEPGASCDAVGFELRCLLWRHQPFDNDVAAARYRLVTQRQREVRHGSTVVLGERDPFADLRRIQGHGFGHLALPGAEIIMTGRGRHHNGRFALQQRAVVRENLHI